MTNWVDKSCEETCWFTPAYIIACLRIYCLISAGSDQFADVATAVTNPTGAKVFLTEIDNSLKIDWGARCGRLPIFINPPYGVVLQQFTSKIRKEVTGGGREVIALLPMGARFSTRYWQKDILNERLNQVCFVNHRVGFLKADGKEDNRNPYDSMIYGYNSNPVAFKAAFKSLGRIGTISLE